MSWATLTTTSCDDASTTETITLGPEGTTTTLGFCETSIPEPGTVAPTTLGEPTTWEAPTTLETLSTPETQTTLETPTTLEAPTTTVATLPASETSSNSLPTTYLSTCSSSIENPSDTQSSRTSSSAILPTEPQEQTGSSTHSFSPLVAGFVTGIALVATIFLILLWLGWRSRRRKVRNRERHEESIEGSENQMEGAEQRISQVEMSEMRNRITELEAELVALRSRVPPSVGTVVEGTEGIERSAQRIRDLEGQIQRWRGEVPSTEPPEYRTNAGTSTQDVQHTTR